LKKTVIVFAPHPDDETFGCGGTIAKKISEGYNVLIVIMTDGRNLFKNALNIDNDPSPDEVRELRRREVLRATEILGVPKENVLFLDFEDGTLERYELEAEKKVIEILNRYRPVEIYLPFKNDSHPDHRATYRILRKCVEKLGLKPRMYQFCILHKFARVGPIFEKLFGLFRRNIVKVDVSRFIKLKEMAIREFKCEFSIISSQQKRPISDKFDKYLKEKELFFIIRT